MSLTLKVEIVLSMRPTNEKRRYSILSFISWVHTKSDPCENAVISCDTPLAVPTLYHLTNENLFEIIMS